MEKKIAIKTPNEWSEHDIKQRILLIWIFSFVQFFCSFLPFAAKIICCSPVLVLPMMILLVHFQYCFALLIFWRMLIVFAAHSLLTYAQCTLHIGQRNDVMCYCSTVVPGLLWIFYFCSRSLSLFLCLSIPRAIIHNAKNALIWNSFLFEYFAAWKHACLFVGSFITNLIIIWNK